MNQSPHKNQLEFQHHWAEQIGGSIINVGCKEDPAGISECSDDVTNMDVLDYDGYLKTSIKHIKGYMQQDFLEWEPDRQYDTLVLGEVLEHCDDERFNEFLTCANKALKKDGAFIITCPQDNRPKEVQHDHPEQLFEVREGVTTWHQNYITKEKLESALSSHGFKIELYETQMWLPEDNVFWHFVIARKEWCYDIN